MLRWSILIILCVTQLLPAAVEASAQTSRDQIRELLGAPVIIQDAALFAASLATFKEHCKRPLEHAGIAEGITRLEFGSLENEDQKVYLHIMNSQYQSNVEIWNSLANKDAERGFCEGLESSILEHAANFVTANPKFFAEKTPKPEEESPAPEFPQSVVQLMKDLTATERLYVYRIAENEVGDDSRLILANPKNQDGEGFLWALKVSALKYHFLSEAIEQDFPTIGAIYADRAEIYSDHIRGQSAWVEFLTAEKSNEKYKNEVYKQLFSTLPSPDTDLTSSRIAELKAIAGEVGVLIIGHAKFASSP